MFRRALRVAKTSTASKDPEWLLWRARLTADNLAICSCACCRNPRKWGKGDDRLTVAEKRQLVSIAD